MARRQGMLRNICKFVAELELIFGIHEMIHEDEGLKHSSLAWLCGLQSGLSDSPGEL